MTNLRTPHLATVATPVAPPRGTVITLTVPAETRLSGAVCRDVTPDVFFPEEDDTDGVAMAKSLCAVCPLRAACLAAALDRDERFGIFGGLTATERDALAGRPSECGTWNGYWRHAYEGTKPCLACRAANGAPRPRSERAGVAA